MLIYKDIKDKNRSIYMCDMCNKKIKFSESTKIFEKNRKENTSRKKYDLCEKCYDIIKKSIKKYSINHTNQ